MRLKSADIQPDWRRPELRHGCLGSVAAALLITLAWAVAAGTEHEALDREGIFTGMAAAVPGVCGAWLASRRPGPPVRPGILLLRLLYHLLPLAATAVLLAALCFPVAAIGEDLAFVTLGAAIGLLASGLLGALLCGFVGAGLAFWDDVPPEAGWLRRASMGILFAAILAMAVGLALGSQHEPGGTRGFGDLVIALIGLRGDVESRGWLWLGRAGALAAAGSLVLVVRTTNRYAPERG